MWDCERGCGSSFLVLLLSFFLAVTLFLIPFLSHVSKSVTLIINIYPNRGLQQRARLKRQSKENKYWQMKEA